jgi:hypothetical protein
MAPSGIASDGEGVGDDVGPGGANGGAGGNVPHAGGSGANLGKPTPGTLPLGAGLQAAPGMVGMPGGDHPAATGTPTPAGTLADLSPAGGGGAGGTGGGGGGDPFGTLVVALAATGRGLGTGTGSGVGSGWLEGASPGARNMPGGPGGKGLDVVFVIDATDSMGPYFEQVKKRADDVISITTGLVGKARFGVVAFKDYGDDYGRSAVKTTALSTDTAAIKEFINALNAGGGGDIPEPTHEALRAATDRQLMGWKTSRRNVIILFSDAPVHSSGRQTAFALARAFASDDLAGTVNIVDTGGAGNGDANVPLRKSVVPDLKTIASEGKGAAFLLQDEQGFWRYLIVSIFGERYRQDVETIVEKYAGNKN